LGIVISLCALPRTASAGCDASSNFCSSVQPKIDARNNSVCTSCHTQKASQATAGDGAAAYVKYAFDMGDLREWMKSSYWKPGFSKAEASRYRAWDGTMPPGVIPYSIDYTVFYALENWRVNCLNTQANIQYDMTANAGAAAPLTGPGSSTSETTIWGPVTVISGVPTCTTQSK